MKKVLQYSGIISLVLGAVAFILMFATHSLAYSAETTVLGVKTTATGWYDGVSAIFGKGTSYASGSFGGFSGEGTSEFSGNLAWNALLAWIFILAALIILLLGVVLPIFNVKALDRFSGVLNLVSIGLLVVAGVLLFFTLPTFAGANEWGSQDNWSLGAGWIIAAILAIAGGVFAALPTIANFVKK